MFTKAATLLLLSALSVKAFNSNPTQQHNRLQKTQLHQTTKPILTAFSLAPTKPTKLPLSGSISTTATLDTPTTTTPTSKPKDKWYEEFEFMRNGTLDKEQLDPFFAQRPQMIADRLTKVATTLYQAKQDWDQEMNATKLCEAISSLGPLAVKVGQTLSERPDLIGKEAALACKTLQTKNKAFDDADAFDVVHETLEYWDGPLAANLVADTDYYKNHPKINAQGKPLYAYLNPKPVAAASLGQVYKARLHDGRDVAIKVQRPEALAVLAMDAQCFRLVFSWREKFGNTKEQWDNFWKSFQLDAQSSSNPIEGQTEQEVRAEGDKDSTVAGVIDRVARDIQMELDYRIEAANGRKFQESLDFLGFVTTPKVVTETNKVLLSEWVRGRHLADLDTKEEGLALTRMAVQACTASMVLTGFVHADPHEGNVMLHDDGRIVFLDFGLMSTVESEYMEGFARGIQALLSDNFEALTEAFVDVGFVTTPVRHRDSLNDLWRKDPNFGVKELARDMEAAMAVTEGGKSRFGALSTVLNKEISPYWLVFMPPYILLLCRTFLTLEGMAATVDPNFNIYEMAMPWAIKRTLSPSTQKGIDVFRNTLLTEENKIQWQRLVELARTGDEEAPQETTKLEASAEMTKQSTELAKKAAMNDAIGALLGSSDGRALRRIIKDLDSVDLMDRLAAPDNRHLLEKVSANYLEAKKDVHKEEKLSAAAELELRKKSLPHSAEFDRLQTKQQKWRKQVVHLLVMSHVRRCLLQWRGLKTTVRLALVSMKVFLTTWWRKRREERQARRQAAGKFGLFATANATAVP